MAPIFGGAAGTSLTHTLTLIPRRSKKWRSSNGLTGRQVTGIVIGALAFGSILVILLIFALRKGWIKSLHLLGKKTPTEKKVAKEKERKEEFLEGKRVERRVYNEGIERGLGVTEAKMEAVRAREGVGS